MSFPLLLATAARQIAGAQAQQIRRQEATQERATLNSAAGQSKEPVVRLQIEYFDHNEEFARYLPRVGTVRREFRDVHSSAPWLLVDLEEPLEYQLKVGEPFQYRLARVNAFLIRSRWEGKEIGDAEGISVFILLVEEGQHPSGDVLDATEYAHIAWGMCRPAPAA